MLPLCPPFINNNLKMLFHEFIGFKHGLLMTNVCEFISVLEFMQTVKTQTLLKPSLKDKS